MAYNNDLENIVTYLNYRKEYRKCSDIFNLLQSSTDAEKALERKGGGVSY